MVMENSAPTQHNRPHDPEAEQAAANHSYVPKHRGAAEPKATALPSHHADAYSRFDDDESDGAPQVEPLAKDPAAKQQEVAAALLSLGAEEVNASGDSRHGHRQLRDSPNQRNDD